MTLLESIFKKAILEGWNLWYLPYFPAIRMDRTITKTRVVFDTSARYNGVSLNNLIYHGPKNCLMFYFAFVDIPLH